MLQKIRERLNAFMEKVREENPNASWGNLLTGIGILVIIAVFSIWYFGSAVDNGGGSEDGEVSGLERLFRRNNNDDEDQPEPESAMTQEVTVQRSEGLWHVAERVCGDGYLYPHVAEENGLQPWEELEVGMTLTVSCDYDTEDSQSPEVPN